MGGPPSFCWVDFGVVYGSCYHFFDVSFGSLPIPLEDTFFLRLHCGACETYVESYWNFCFHFHICAGLAANLQSRLAWSDLVGKILLVVCVCDLESIFSRVLMIIWGIWMNWCDFIWNHKLLSAWQIVKDAQILLAKWNIMQNVTQNVITTNNCDRNKQTLIKCDFWCYVDASIFQNYGRTGYEGYIRSKEGEFMKAWTGWIQPKMQLHEG